MALQKKNGRWGISSQYTQEQKSQKALIEGDIACFRVGQTTVIPLYIVFAMLGETSLAGPSNLKYLPRTP